MTDTYITFSLDLDAQDARNVCLNNNEKKRECQISIWEVFFSCKRLKVILKHYKLSPYKRSLIMKKRKEGERERGKEEEKQKRC